MGVLGDGKNVLLSEAHLRKPQKEGAEKRSPDPRRMLEPGGMKKDQLTMETQREDKEARGDSSCR